LIPRSSTLVVTVPEDLANSAKSADQTIPEIAIHPVGENARRSLNAMMDDHRNSSIHIFFARIETNPAARIPAGRCPLVDLDLAPQPCDNPNANADPAPTLRAK